VLLPERLTQQALSQLLPDERQQWLAHPLQAHGLLMGIDALRGAAATLRALNERVDGTGFPDRLGHQAIGMGTRLLMVAVDYESLLAGAMVRARLSRTEALQVLLTSSGQRLDGHVVNLFIESMRAPVAKLARTCVRSSADLTPGLHLAEDLLSKEGHLLLARGHVVDAVLIAHIRTYEEQNQVRLKFAAVDPEGAS
jgi:response regulator RpfG family c-di-GMP phosphodiesterase